MSTCSNSVRWLKAIVALGACAACAMSLTAQPLAAQDTTLDPANSVKVDLPPDSPLDLISKDLGDSRATSRGGAIVLDLHMGLTLRNSGSKHIRGVTLLVTAQEFAPGGKGSVARPSIDVAPGQTFTLPVDIRLVRPVQQTAGPLVHVQLDGVLFDDLTFFGPNKLNSQRALTFWEVEAQRDRTYFKQALQARGESALGEEMRKSLARQADRTQLDVSLTRNGRAVGAAVPATDHVAQFAFLNLPNAPVQPVEGWAAISGNEARSPQIEVVNNSGKAVRYVEIGWLVKDKQGQEYLAGSVPASESTLLLPSGHRTRLLQDTALKFSRTGHPIEIEGMTGYVSEVEFADGHVWVPSRRDLDSSPLLRVTAPSPEEQRLADVYSKKGLAALVADLSRY
jgi:hypothetical protein